MLNFGGKTYSNTTRAHINSFLNFYGFDKCTKKENKMEIRVYCNDNRKWLNIVYGYLF